MLKDGGSPGICNEILDRLVKLDDSVLEPGQLSLELRSLRANAVEQHDKLVLSAGWILTVGG